LGSANGEQAALLADGLTVSWGHGFLSGAFLDEDDFPTLIYVCCTSCIPFFVQQRFDLFSLFHLQGSVRSPLWLPERSKLWAWWLFSQLRCISDSGFSFLEAFYFGF